MSRTLLHIDSSIRGGDSDSRNLSARLVEQWQAENVQDRVVSRDLADKPPQPIDGYLLGGLFAPEEQHTEEMKQALARANELLDEFMVSDVVVIGAPMYNFSIPSTLKTWIDYLCRAGTTFRYTENGPEGLVKNKTVVIVSTRGSVFEDSPLDHQVAYLKTVFGFLGVEDIHVVQAEGLNISPEQRERSIAAAEADIATLVAESRMAA